MARYLQLDIQFTKAILPLVKCDTCTCRLKSFTPENVKSENKVCTYGQISYNCWFQNCENPCLSRRCGAIYDIIQNHESTPSKLNRKNTHSQKGTADPWSIDKCFINAPGYNHKTSSTDSDWTTLFQVRDHSDNNFYLCSDIMAILQDCMEHVNQPNFHQAEQNQEIKELKRLWVGDSHKLQQPENEKAKTGNNISTGPKYPKYATKTARLTSFNDCGDIVIPPDNLATSGFFYAGFGDCVRCFQCGVGLRHWSYEDDPWIEHCRWSKDCLFVKQVKGQEFVNLVQMAVQYSQNTTSGNITGTKTQSSEDAVMEQQMHTNAAQSVLEMGYNPNVIRIAIRALKDANEGQTLTAATLMEKIFELEDEALDSLEHSQLVQGTPPSQQNTRSAQNTDSNNTQRVSLDTSSVSSKNVSTQSVSFDDASSSAGCLIQKTSKAQSKKSQLLEQQKLKQENEQLKQQSMCTKCKKNDVSIVFLPCGHLVTCETCAPSVRYCSVQDCGKYVKGTVRTYLA